MLKKLAVLSFLMFSPNLLAAEKAKEIKDATSVELGTATKAEMVTVKKWEDVAPFADQIIVYKATNFSLIGWDKGYPLNQDQSERIGYVSKEPLRGYGYPLDRLLKKNAVPGSFCLENSLIQDNENQAILMRPATLAEKAAILKAIQENKAEFDYMFRCQNAISALNRQ